MAVLVVILCFILYGLGYFVYSRYLSEKVFALRPEAQTPAHTQYDGVDYVPTNRVILFGHHYASIAGLAPMLGPALAVIWGWFPAMLWVVIGALLIGCVHDFSALVLSIRAKGESIGKVAEGLIGKRAMILFHLIIFFLVALAMGVFVYVIGFLFAPAPDPAQKSIHFPQAVIPSFGLMAMAMVLGVLLFYRRIALKHLLVIGFGGALVLVYVAGATPLTTVLRLDNPQKAPTTYGWAVILLIYAFLASSLPVWLLLQPRDFINSLLLYVGLLMIYLGFFLKAPSFQAPAFRLEVEGAPSIFPFVFIVIACGAASGFHSLVSSGTTAKQIDKETDARLIGYGGMIGESLLGLLAVIATTAGFTTSAGWSEHYKNWSLSQGLGPKVAVFIQGATHFLSTWGIDASLSSTFIAVIVVSYALTSLDSATRLLRYNIEEMTRLRNRYLTSILAVIAIGFFAFYQINGKPAGLALWKLFGTTNQMLAGLALLAGVVYLYQRGRNFWVVLLPMAFLLIATITGLIENLISFWEKKEFLLLTIGSFLLILAVWLIIEGGLAIKRQKRKTNSLDIAL